MAVLVTADVPGQTEETYDQMLAVLGPATSASEGLHRPWRRAAGDGWRSFEIWESPEDATQFFARHIHPNLPQGIKPRRTMLQLHSLVKAG